MQKNSIIFLVIFISAIIFGFFWFSGSHAQVGTLNIIKGEVNVLRNNANIKGDNGSSLFVSDILKLGLESSVSITLSDGSIVRIEAGTEVKIVDLSFYGQGSGIKKAVFQITHGRIWSNVKPLQNGGTYEIETPTIVATVRGTLFDVSYLNNINKIYVAKGLVGAHPKDNSNLGQNINEGFVFEAIDTNLYADFNKQPRRATEADNDSWIQFNKQKDEFTPTSASNDSRKTSSSTIILPISPKKNLPLNNVIPLLPPSKNTPLPPKDTTTNTETIVPPVKSTTGVSDLSPKASLRLSVTYQKLESQDQYYFSQTQFKAVAYYNDISLGDVTRSVAWRVSGSAKGLIDKNGLYTAEMKGTDTVVAQYQGLEVSTQIITP